MVFKAGCKPGVVLDNCAYAYHDGVDCMTELVDELSRVWVGDPLRISCPGSNATIKGSRTFQDNKGVRGGRIFYKDLVQAAALSFANRHCYVKTLTFQKGKAAPRYPWVRIFHPCHNPFDTTFQYRLSARRCAPRVVAWL